MLLETSWNVTTRCSFITTNGDNLLITNLLLKVTKGCNNSPWEGLNVSLRRPQPPNFQIHRCEVFSHQIDVPLMLGYEQLVSNVQFDRTNAQGPLLLFRSLNISSQNSQYNHTYSLNYNDHELLPVTFSCSGSVRCTINCAQHYLLEWLQVKTGTESSPLITTSGLMLAIYHAPTPWLYA